VVCLGGAFLLERLYPIVCSGRLQVTHLQVQLCRATRAHKSVGKSKQPADADSLSAVPGSVW
jgi:hypothetical protein